MDNLNTPIPANTVKLDDRSRRKLAEIHYIIESSGKLTALMSFAHVMTWAEKDISGPIAIMSEDWEGFARAMNGMKAIQLNIINAIAQEEANRFILNDRGGQREFWESVAKMTYNAMRRQ